MSTILGNNLKKCRMELHLTQNEVSIGTNIPRGTYTHYELGKREPDNDTLLILAKFFNKNPSDLLGYNEGEKPIELKNILENEAQVTLNGRLVTQEDKEKMLRILEALYYKAKEMNEKK